MHRKMLVARYAAARGHRQEKRFSQCRNAIRNPAKSRSIEAEPAQTACITLMIDPGTIVGGTRENGPHLPKFHPWRLFFRIGLCGALSALLSGGLFVLGYALRETLPFE